MSKLDFFRTMINDVADPDTFVADENKSSSDLGANVFIDTGSYTLNAALSGSIYGGMPGNRTVVFAGDPAVGKTFLALGIVRRFLEQHQDGRVVYFDTESAVTNHMLVQLGIPTDRIAKSEPETIEKFRTVAVRLLDKYAESKTKFPLLFVLDSLSALPSSKEVGDITDGKDTRDMTKSQLLKGAFRVLRLKLAKHNVAMIVTAHVYAVIGSMFPTKTMAGGSGAQYAADTIVFLSKRKEKDGEKDHIGNVVHVRMEKSRLAREGTKVDTRILFDGGLDRYYGLLEPAVNVGLVKKVSNKYEFPDGTKAFEKAVLKNPEKYFTPELIDQLDELLKPLFSYSGAEAGDEGDGNAE